MVRTLRLVAATLGLGAVAAASCTTYTSELLEGSGSGGPMTCALGYCWWSTKTPEGCEDVGIPRLADKPKPSQSSNSVGSIYVGMKRLYLGETMPPVRGPAIADAAKATQPWQWIGVNIDGVCTNPIGCSTAEKNVVPCKTGRGIVKPADGVGCRDNAFGQLLPIAAQNPELGPPLGLTEKDMNCEFRRGGYNIIFKISGYNGELNDDSVRVDLYSSPGLESNMANWDCLAQKDSWEKLPSWLPENPWYINRADLDGEPTNGELPNAKRAYDPSAYVKDGYLVAHLADGTEVRFIGDNATVRPALQGGSEPYPLAHLPGGFRLILHRITLTAHLHQDSGMWVLDDGVIAGAMIKDYILAGFEEAGFCAKFMSDPGQYDTLANYLTNNDDILSTPTNAPDTTCDAMSVGIGFEATTVTPGAAKDVSVLHRCAAPDYPKP
ncbi:MAG: hypothetical protein OZ921_01255 [Sorangiineae bacterium]|nr:hypothetical protein [Polyangiaceae bacterium]MEB2321111.1 hypothetical protein [Sorangiineae bacterium]